MTRPLHFLVVEDEPEIADLLSIYLSQEFDATFRFSFGGFEAIDLIEKNPTQYDLIFCDYRMAHGSGADVINYLKKIGMPIPLILATSEVKADHLELLDNPSLGYIQKPFDDLQIRNEVQRLLGVKMAAEEPKKYFPVSLSALSRIKDIKSNLYIKINEQKYIKIQKADSTFDGEAQKKYEGKGVAVLYVEQSEYPQLIEEFQSLVNSHMLFSVDSTLDYDSLQVSSAVQEVVSGFVKTLGFSEQTEALAKKNIALVHTLAKQTDSLDSLLGAVLNSQLGYSYQHSTLVAILLSELAPLYEFENQHSLEILTMAAFLHDSVLNDYQSKNEDRFISALQMGIKINAEDLEMVKNHPRIISDQLKLWKHCPPELIEIIISHHEKPDGQGFPSGLKAEQLSIFSAFFVVCEEFVKTYLENKNLASTIDQWKKKKPLYDFRFFREVYSLLMGKLLQEHNKAAS